jgi:hypothetical protein
MTRGTVFTAEVSGVRETLSVLRAVDKKAFFAATGKIKKAAGGMIEIIDGTIPTGPPSRGFAHNGRTGWVNRKKPTAVYGGRRSSGNRDRQEWPLVTIQVKSAPVEIADMAGRGPADGPKIESLTRALGQYGNPSRFVYRNSDRVRKEAADAIVDAMRDVMRKENARLTRYTEGA